MMTLYWATGGLVLPILTDVTHTLTMPAALKGTIMGLLKRRGHRFQVTDKGGRRDRSRVQWRMIARFGLLLGLTVAGMMYANLADYTPERQDAGPTAIVVFWSAYNIVVLLLAMAVCVDLPRYRREERFATSEPVQVSAGEDVFTAPLLDISVAGAHILAPAPAPQGSIVRLKLQDLGEVAARIVRVTADDFAVAFIDTDHQQNALIRKVYTGRYGQRPQGVRGRHILNALIARALR